MVDTGGSRGSHTDGFVTVQVTPSTVATTGTSHRRHLMTTDTHAFARSEIETG